MSPEIASSIKVEQQPSVDVTRQQPKPVEGANEETMEQYAARREAEMRGEAPPERDTPAAATDDTKTAAATDKPAAATDDAAPGDKTTPAPATEEDENPEKLIEETHKAKKGIEKKFSKLTSARDTALAEAATAKQEAATAKAEAERLAAELETARKAAEKPAPVVPAAEEDPAPNRNDFEDPDAYQAALTGHAARQEIRKSNEAAEAKARERREADAAEADKQRQARVQEQIVTLHKTFNDRVEKSKPDYPDYDVKVTNNEKLTLRNDIFFTVEQSNMAPHILYHLADHPEEAASLNAMPPIQAAMRIGEIQAELRIARKPKPSKAAEPVKPVGHRSSPERKNPDDETMEEYAARREREETQKREAARRRAH